MALNINAPKNRFLMPFFVLLVIVLAPFALFFSLIRLPFAKRRTDKLPSILQYDWMPRKKYVYLGFTSGFALTDYVKEKILPSYGNHIVWDEWNRDLCMWKSSEPDETHRITTFWQDIGGDFDGDPMIIIATYKPGNFSISFDNHNFHQFMMYEDSESTFYDGKELAPDVAEKKIDSIINQAIENWN